MARKAKRRRVKRKTWTRSEVAELRRYAKDKMRVKKISRLMRRSVGSLRQKEGRYVSGSDIVVEDNAI